METLSFLIKPVSYQCNLSCGYCFYKRVHTVYPGNHTVMSLAVAERLIQSALDTDATYISFCWQGGEPTLAGLDFFKEIVTIQKRYKKVFQVIENSLQTNGILLNDEWCSFLANNQFLVGISLDGPKEIHNAYRKDYAGHGSFDKVMQAIALMNEYSVQYNILTLLTDANAEKANEVYSFFRQHNFAYLQFIPCFEHDEKGNLLPYSVNGVNVGNFYCQLFDQWYHDGFPFVQVRMFQDILIHSIEKGKTSCCWLPLCDSYIVVEHNGDCYPCDFFVYPQWHLGNIMSCRLQDILINPLRDTFKKIKQQTECDDNCELYDFCMGDCTRYRFTSNSIEMKKSEYCSAWKMLFEHYKRYETVLHNRINNLRSSINSGTYYKTQRNDLCPCGLGIKFKKCCGRAPLAI